MSDEFNEDSSLAELVTALTRAGPPPEITGPEEALTRLGVYVSQLGRVVALMQARLDEMESERRQQVTVSHRQVLNLQRAIREKAQATCIKYTLHSRGDEAAFRAAMLKAVYQRNRIKNLHDLPLAALHAATEQIANFADYALVMERRKQA